MSSQWTINITVRDGGESQSNTEKVKVEGDIYKDRDRISFGTNLNAGLKEKLKTISHDEDIPIVELVNKAVRNLIEDLEEENGEYKIPDPFKVQSS